MSMPWFKHYNNASTSLSIQKMMIDLGIIGYAYYFLLLELLCSKFDGSNCVIDLTLSEVAVKLRYDYSWLNVHCDRFLCFWIETHYPCTICA